MTPTCTALRTLPDFLDEWTRAIEPTVREPTYRSYPPTIRNHITPHIGPPGSIN
ncbi:MAG: hypothetical protein GWN79_18310 [Actinobacteria bacterium]|nr:hypothetical protein [Actinomycetota bacterium]NIU20906.1 hypothetical protein [Actinomycetota bacterium]